MVVAAHVMAAEIGWFFGAIGDEFDGGVGWMLLLKQSSKFE